MIKKKPVITVLWILIAIIAAAAIVCYITLPHWKGIYLAGCGGFLILNLFLIMFFVNKNIKH